MTPLEGDPENETEYGLVMPFVVCQSKGGPYDDESYVAGYEMGLLDANLRVLKMMGATGPIHRTLHEFNRDQADLIAMHHGFKVGFKPVGEGWLAGVFDLVEEEGP